MKYRRFTALSLYCIIVLFFDTYQFHFKNQSRERFDLAAGFSCAVSQFLRDVKFPLRTYRHHGEGFCPALDNLVGTERSRFFTLVRAVEFGSVNQRTFVVYFHFAAVSGDFTCTFGDNLVLQAARSGYNAFFGLVLARNFSPAALLSAYFFSMALAFTASI